MAESHSRKHQSKHTEISKRCQDEEKLEHKVPTTALPNPSPNTLTTVTVSHSQKHTLSQRNVGAEVHVSLLYPISIDKHINCM